MKRYEEILDLIAEAARTSAHARRAFELMTNGKRESKYQLKVRQKLISGRMKEVSDL